MLQRDINSTVEKERGRGGSVIQNKVNDTTRVLGTIYCKKEGSTNLAKRWETKV